MPRVDLQAVITAKDEASRTFQTVGRSVSDLGNRLQRDLKIAAAVATTSIAAIGAFSVKVAADYEQNRVAFVTMLGSAEKAGQLLKQISDFARKTPFTLPEVVEGSKQLLAYGFAQEDVIRTMRMLGDVAAGLKIPMSDMVYLYGTLRAQGRAYTRDIIQFTMRGIPMMEMLAKVMGVSTDKVKELVEAGKIGFPEVQKAFEMMTGEGGKFQNLMENQSRTLAGVWSNLRDNMTRLALSFMGISEEGVIKEGGLFFRIKIAAEGLLAWLDANQDKISNHFENIANKIVEFGKMVWQVTQWLLEHKTVLYLTGIVLLGLAAIIGAPLAALGLLMTTIGLLIAVWYQFIGLVRDLWSLMVSQLRSAFLTTEYSLRNLLAVIVAFGIALRNYFIAVWHQAASVVTNAGITILTIIRRIIDAIRSLPIKMRGVFGFQRGGFIPYTGFHYLHQGERVIPSGLTTTSGSNITINFYGDITNTSAVSLDEIGRRIARQLELARQGAY